MKLKKERIKNREGFVFNVVKDGGSEENGEKVVLGKSNENGG